MGSDLIAHVIVGFYVFTHGLWQLFNHIKLHVWNKKLYKSLPWFPTPKVRYLELYAIIAGTTLLIFTQIIIKKNGRRLPLDPDGAILSTHFRNIEHSLIAFSFLIYAVFSIIIDKKIGDNYNAMNGFSHLLQAFGYSQELLLFHVHSNDQLGVEGEYHFLLRIVVVLSPATTLMGIGYPRSFEVSFVRSFSILFQGVWLMVTGVMLWTPEFVPKDCFLKLEETKRIKLRCRSSEALQRAISLVNMQYSWCLILVIVFCMCLYLFLNKVYGESSKYQTLLPKYEEKKEDKN